MSSALPVSVPAGLFELLHAASAIEGLVESRLAAEGLSIAKLAALTRLAQADGSLPLGQLAERLACVRSNVTQLIDRLEADGLVTRAFDPSDRRSRLAVLTPDGRAAQGRGMTVQQQVERELFGRLAGDESRRLMELIAKLAKP